MRRLFFAACVITAASVASAQQMSADAQDHMDRARAAMGRKQFQEAIGEFRRVLKTEKVCEECYFQLARAYQKLGANKDALESARKALEISPDDTWRAVAHNLIGVVLSAQMGSDKLHGQQAELEYRTALQLNPNDRATYFNLGSELMKEGRDAEGIAALTEYLKRAPDGPEAKAAHTLIDNPRRARGTFLPVDFSVVTKGGEYLTADELKGKVVVLDFWATWCVPCQ
jgi:tetratricopeptide (TPR) repeat protein